MAKLLAYAEPSDTVVVWRIDQLGRSLIDVLNTVNLLRERGDVHLRSVSDAIDPETTAGRTMLNMLATLAEYERELIVERSTPGSPRPGRAVGLVNRAVRIRSVVPPVEGLDGHAYRWTEESQGCRRT